MGRPPCCDKEGVKKGPWTPEEDITLVSFVQENGPGNWRAVPMKTGLKRCSKSCRLRWANYLRPGIKRGSFTDHEEKMIIQLQALLGNKWAAIASYLPERTDNDIKNYWNTHLKKKLKRLQIGSGNHSNFDGFSSNSNSNSISRGQWERRLQTDINTAKQALQDALSFENTNHLPELVLSNPNDACLSYPNPGLQQPFSYASSTENIARLLKDWVKKTPKSEESKSSNSTQNSSNNEIHSSSIKSKSGIDLSEAFESLFGFDQSSNSVFSRSTSTKTGPDPNGFAVLDENWLLGEQGKEYLTNFSFDENQDLF